MNRKTLVLLAVVGLLAPVLAACGGSDGADQGGDAIVVGTTDRFAASQDAPAPSTRPPPTTPVPGTCSARPSRPW
ncbi:hypothetical protein ACFQVA_06125 [Actinomadura keratinilytica]